MRSTMVRECSVALSNGDWLTVAPYEPVTLDDVVATVAWFNGVRPSWMRPLTVSVERSRVSAWMR